MTGHDYTMLESYVGYFHYNWPWTCIGIIINPDRAVLHHRINGNEACQGINTNVLGRCAKSSLYPKI